LNVWEAIRNNLDLTVVILNRWLCGNIGKLTLCLFLLLPFQEGVASPNKTRESIDSFNPHLYLNELILESELYENPENEAFNLNRYYDALEPPGQDGMLGRYSILMKDSVYFLIPAATVLGALYIMPEEVTNWSRDDISLKYGLEKWQENVKSWHWDSDEDWINYIGHPYFGPTYFIYARHYGYSRFESLCFSFAISSFYEMGLEAWAEQVSIQDMLVTPLFGWALAEVLLPIEYYIKKNDGKILNSQILGSTSLFLIDPFGHVVPPLKKWIDAIFSSDTDISMLPFVSRSNYFDQEEGQHSIEERYGLQLTVRW